jgi:hypothetical protein
MKVAMKPGKLLFFLLLCAATPAHCGEFDALVANSPFATRITLNRNGEDGGTAYEVRGFFCVGNAKFFNIYSLGSNQFTWVLQGDSSKHLIVDTFDEKNEILHFHSRKGERHAAPVKSAKLDTSSIEVTMH